MLEMDHPLDNPSDRLPVLERIVESSTHMVVITDAEHRIRWVNPRFIAVTGWSLDEVRGRRPGDFLHGPQTDRKLSASVRAAFSAGQSACELELVNYRKGGHAFTVLLRIEPIRHPDGHTLGYFSVQTDVSHLRELERTNARLQFHMEQAQQIAGIGRIDVLGDGHRMRWSAEVYAVLESSPGTLEPGYATLLRFLSRQEQRRLTRLLRQSQISGEAFDQEFAITTAKGTHRWVRCRGVPEREGRRFRAPGTWTVQDVSSYRDLIEQKRRNNRRLSAMVSERTRDLEEANRSLEAFSHALSHDLKKPIRHMVSYAEVVREALERQDSDLAGRGCAQVIRAGIKLQKMVDGFLAFARLGRQGLSPSRVDLALMIAECMDEMASSFPGRSCECEGVERLPVIHADPVLIREVWCNLLDNAFKYSAMREQTRIEWRCDEDERGWTVSLRDNGCGFPPEQQTHIFSMFGRASPDGSIPGDGIGLALCQRIVQSHGGRLWADGQPDAGATFHVWLPKPLAPEPP